MLMRTGRGWLAGWLIGLVLWHGLDPLRGSLKLGLHRRMSSGSGRAQQCPRPQPPTAFAMCAGYFRQSINSLV